MGSFSLNIERFVAKAKGNIDLVVRKVALDMFRRVVMKSPVDTGRFKGNWLVGIGSVPAGTIELSADITHQDGKETERKSAHRSSASGEANMARVTAAALGLKAGDVITLVNNLSYARRLEYGHSKQAPEGMVRVTVLEYGGVVRGAAAEVR